MKRAAFKGECEVISVIFHELLGFGVVSIFEGDVDVFNSTFGFVEEVFEHYCTGCVI